MRKYLYLLLLVFLNLQAKAQLGGTYYVYVGDAGYNNATSPCEVYSTTTPHITGSFVLQSVITGIAAPGQKLNAVGLSCINGLLYGMQFPNAAATATGELYRVNPSTGLAQNLGTIDPPIPSAPGFGLINTTAGTLDQLDNYYFTAYTYTGDLQNPPYNINFLKVYLGKIPHVGALPVAPPGGIHYIPQYIELEFMSDPAIKLGFQSFLDHFDYHTPSNSDGGAEDLAINPFDGLFYSYFSYPNPSDPAHLVHHPIKISLVTNTIRAVGTVKNSSPDREIAGCYFDLDPGGGAIHFFVLFTDGEYGTVNLTTGALNYPLSTTIFPLNSGNLRGDLASSVCAIPLPLELIRFSGYYNPGYNILEWETAKEENVGKIEVTRSQDARTFQTIAALPPKGNNSKYFYQDDYSDAAFYRLRIVDLDGSVSYSPMVYLKGAGAGSDKMIIVYPTMVSEDYFMLSGLKEASIIRVYNVEGKLVSQTNTDAASLQVGLKAVPGMYVVSVSDTQGHLLLSQRIVKR